MVCGICCLALWCAWPVALPLAVVACVLGLYGLHSQYRGMAIAGLVTSIVGLGWYGVLFSLYVWGLTLGGLHPYSSGYHVSAPVCLLRRVLRPKRVVPEHQGEGAVRVLRRR